MKKILASILILISIFSIWFATLSPQEQDIANNVIDIVKDEISKKDIESQILKYNTFISQLGSVLLMIKEDDRELIQYVVNKFVEIRNNLENNSENSSNWNLWDTENINNVDWEVVRNSILEWHNSVRRDLWLDEYKLEKKLNHTANVRADYLVDLWSATHKRLASDGYYNYWSIKDWFNNQWVEFKWSWTQFTESIWYRSYSCKQDDCTQELLNTIRKSFDFFMSEASDNGAHYRAIVHPNFEYIWIGYDTNGSNSFAVIHYWNEVK